MATVFPTPTVKRLPKMSVDSNQPVTVGETIAVTAAALTIGAALGFGVVIPANCEVLFTLLDATDMDTGGSPLLTLGIGDASSNVRFMAANAIGQTGAVPVGPQIAKAGFGFKPTVDTLVQVYCVAIPATAAAGTIKWAITYVSN